MSLKLVSHPCSSFSGIFLAAIIYNLFGCEEFDTLVQHSVIMKSILFSVLFCYAVAYGQNPHTSSLPALKKNHIVISERYISEIECIKKLDAVLKARWSEELNDIPTSDLDMDDLPKTPWMDKDSRYAKYNLFADEWLMEEVQPIQRINQCVFNLLWDVSDPEVAAAIDADLLSCVTKLVSTNSYEEGYHKRDFENLLNISSAEQLPFRKFTNAFEFVELMFQNRERKTWTNLEGLVYGFVKGLAPDNADQNRRYFRVNQHCEWKNAKALREASSQAARLKEFTSQIRHSVNKQLASRLLKNWNLNTILPSDRYEQWLKSRREMISRIEREVETLRTQNKDVQWLCEYAAELATILTDVQSEILLTKETSSVHLEASDVASMSRTIETALAEVDETRHAAVKKIADKQDEGTRCLSSLVTFVQNHRKYELASAFIDETYVYPELYCENTSKNPDLNRITYCNCIGSVCVFYDLAALFAEDYNLVKSSDGIYKIVRSGIKSKRKVNYCHTLTNLYRKK